MRRLLVLARAVLAHVSRPDGRPRPLPGAEELRWNRLARERQYVELVQVRGVAEKWRNGLTGLTGLLAVVLAVAAPQASDKLPFSYRLPIGVLLLAALVVLAFGSWWAMRAAFGLPHDVRDNGVRLREWTAKATVAAVKDLGGARKATAAGFAVLAVAAFLSVVAPQVKIQRVARVVSTDGQAYCGDLTTEPDGGAVVVTGYDGTEHRLALGTVRNLELRDGGC